MEWVDFSASDGNDKRSLKLKVTELDDLLAKEEAEKQQMAEELRKAKLHVRCLKKCLKAVLISVFVFVLFFVFGSSNETTTVMYLGP